MAQISIIFLPSWNPPFFWGFLLEFLQHSGFQFVLNNLCYYKDQLSKHLAVEILHIMPRILHSAVNIYIKFTVNCLLNSSLCSINSKDICTYPWHIHAYIGIHAACIQPHICIHRVAFSAYIQIIVNYAYSAYLISITWFILCIIYITVLSK